MSAWHVGIELGIVVSHLTSVFAIVYFLLSSLLAQHQNGFKPTIAVKELLNKSEF